MIWPSFRQKNDLFCELGAIANFSRLSLEKRRIRPNVQLCAPIMCTFKYKFRLFYRPTKQCFTCVMYVTWNDKSERGGYSMSYISARTLYSIITLIVGYGLPYFNAWTKRFQTNTRRSTDHTVMWHGNTASVPNFTFVGHSGTPKMYSVLKTFLPVTTRRQTSCLTHRTETAWENCQNYAEQKTSIVDDVSWKTTFSNKTSNSLAWPIDSMKQVQPKINAALRPLWRWKVL